MELFSVPGGAGHHPVTASQLVRLLGFALPGIGPDDYLMTADLDLWPMSPAFWDGVLARAHRRGSEDGLWVYNGLWSWRQIVKGGDHLAVSVLGASARTWCSLTLRALSLHADSLTPAQAKSGGGTGASLDPLLGNVAWQTRVGGPLSALFAPDVRWDASNPPTCTWRRRDGALRMKFPGADAAAPTGGGASAPGAVAAALRRRAAARAAAGLGETGVATSDGDTLEVAAVQQQLQLQLGNAATGAGTGVAPPAAPPSAPVVITPTVSTLLAALLEAGHVTTGLVWSHNVSVADLKRTGSKLWYWDQHAVSQAERRLGLCPTLAHLGGASESFPRCVLNRDLRRLNRDEWSVPVEEVEEDAVVAAQPDNAAAGAAAATQPPRPLRDRFTDAHAHPRWVVDSPWKLLRPWG